MLAEINACREAYIQPANMRLQVAGDLTDVVSEYLHHEPHRNHTAPSHPTALPPHDSTTPHVCLSGLGHLRLAE